MIAAECEPLHPGRYAGCTQILYDLGRGVLVLDLAHSDRWQSGHDEGYTEKGWQIWARSDGTLVEAYADHSAGRWDPWTYRLLDVRPIGYREVVRRYGADKIVEALGAWLSKRTREHDAMATEEQARRAKLETALAALRR